MTTPTLGVDDMHTGQQEVAGISDVSRLEAIRRGDVPRPPLCAFSHGVNMWVRWRAESGRRPTRRRDGASTSGALEVHLWRTIMFELCGDTWKEDLAAVPASTPSGPIPGAGIPGSGALSDSDSVLAHE